VLISVVIEGNEDIAMPQSWQNMVVKDAAIFDIATDAKSISVHVFEPVLQKMPHGLLCSQPQRSLLQFVQHLLEGFMSFLACLAVHLFARTVLKRNTCHPALVRFALIQ
jgi:hypothetical protein